MSTLGAWRSDENLMATDATKPEWFADEQFWIATYPFMFPDSRLAAASVEVDEILALVQTNGGSALDMACGPGRHSIPLAERGFKVTGVDRSPFLLARARARATDRGVNVEWVEADMRDFRRPAAFDLALSLFTSIGYFQDDAENQRVLDNIASSLRIGGALVVDVLGKEVLARVFNPTGSDENPDGLVIQRRRVEGDWERIENEWILLRDGTTQTFLFEHWVYSAHELKEMLMRAGFADVRVYGNYHGDPYGLDAKRLVAVGRKVARLNAVLPEG